VNIQSMEPSTVGAGRTPTPPLLEKNRSGKHMDNEQMPTKMSAKGLDVFYNGKQALFGVDLDIPEQAVTALIGPSGCGKSTFLRCLNRMNDTIDGCDVKGDVTIDGQNIYDRELDVVELRARIGMVFQKPNPFPKSIYENVAYGPRIHGLSDDRQELDEIVQTSLDRAGWMNLAPAFLAASSNGSASPALSRSARKLS